MRVVVAGSPASYHGHWHVLEYWGEAWYPFLDSRSGTLVCVDAVSGNVITFFHDQPDRSIVAPSLSAFLDAVAEAMEAGECVVEDIGVRLADVHHPLAVALFGA